MHPRQKQIVWTPELAYAVGLITTDGNLSPDGRHFTFVSNDYNLIETFKSCLEITNQIVKKKSGFTGKVSSFKVQFGNVTLYRWLIEIGLMPNKSKRMGSLLVPDDLFFDFLRGHLDGDGTIRRYQDPVYPKSTRLYVTFLSASLPHLQWIHETIQRMLDIKGFLRRPPGVFSLTFSKQASLILLSELYRDNSAPRLERKYIQAKDLLPIHA